MRYATRKIFKDYGGTVLIAVALALLIRTFVIEAYRIPSFSMKPTLVSGDTIFVAKWPVWMQKVYLPSRGDVVVFSSTDPSGTPSPDYVRRVIGLPGDQVAVKKGIVFLNGQPLAHPNATDGACLAETLPPDREYQICRDLPIMEDWGPEKVPADSIFVLSDSRSSVEDKKRKKLFGMVPIASLKGRALWVWLSIEPNRDLQTLSSWLPRFRFERMFQRIR